MNFYDIDWEEYRENIYTEILELIDRKDNGEIKEYEYFDLTEELEEKYDILNNPEFLEFKRRIIEGVPKYIPEEGIEEFIKTYDFIDSYIAAVMGIYINKMTGIEGTTVFSQIPSILWELSWMYPDYSKRI